MQALGTQFNIELVSDTLRVTLIEGHLAVSPQRTRLLPLGGGAELRPIEMHAGQQLVARSEEPARLHTDVDLTEATGWQVGKLFFDDEPLASACERINRYAREQIIVHPSAAGIAISGVFRAGDSKAFVEALAAYFPLTVQRTRDGNLELIRRGAEDTSAVL